MGVLSWYRNHWTTALGAVVVSCIGIGLAAGEAWTCDDAFISYRYARNLVEGHGLVFNPGEKVEGFTNLLWTVWIALGLKLGVEAQAWSVAFGLVSYAAVLLVLLRFHAELRQRLTLGTYAFPIAATIAALAPDLRAYATGGLETSAYTATAFAGYMAVVRGVERRTFSPAPLGLLFGTATLLRPDGAIFAGIAGLAVLVASRRRFRDATVFALTWGFVWGGATAWRVHYYGDFVPNTYYAKSAYLTWHTQGLRYAHLYLVKYWPLVVGLFAAVGAAWRLRRRLSHLEDEQRWCLAHVTLSAACVLLYGYYVVRVGGDFMYARLLVPLTPYLAILCELALARASVTRPLAHAQLVVLGLILVEFAPRPVHGEQWIDGVADEPSFYNRKKVLEDEEKARVIAKYFDGLPVRIAFLGTEARVMYMARIPVAIESETGLTDGTIAHQKLRERGRIGHEKRADLQYLIGQRRAHFAIAPWADEELKLKEHIPLWKIQLDDVDAWVLHWDPALLGQLRKRGARFRDFAVYLDRYIESLHARPASQVRADLAKFRLFYFDHVGDPARLRPLVARARRAKSGIAPQRRPGPNKNGGPDGVVPQRGPILPRR